MTKTLFVVGDGQVTTTPDHPRGAMLRAYDKQTGNEVGAVLDAGAAERLADELHRSAAASTSSSRSAAALIRGSTSRSRCRSR